MTLSYQLGPEIVGPEVVMPGVVGPGDVILPVELGRQYHHVLLEV